MRGEVGEGGRRGKVGEGGGRDKVVERGGGRESGEKGLLYSRRGPTEVLIVRVPRSWYILLSLLAAPTNTHTHSWETESAGEN